MLVVLLLLVVVWVYNNIINNNILGHAGAIISGGKGTAKAKMEALTAIGARVVETPAMIGEAMYEMMKAAGKV